MGRGGKDIQEELSPFRMLSLRWSKIVSNSAQPITDLEKKEGIEDFACSLAGLEHRDGKEENNSLDRSFSLDVREFQRKTQNDGEEGRELFDGDSVNAEIECCCLSRVKLE